ncbi:MAG: ASKHA domain-containing protein [Armatimonadota bacterium]
MVSRDLTIKFKPSGRAVKVKGGVSLISVLETLGLTVDMPCGGKGRCGKCTVLFEQGAPAPTPTEEDRLSEIDLLNGYRLSCQTVLDSDAVILIPNSHDSSYVLTRGMSRHIPLAPAITKRRAVIPVPSIEDQRSDLDRVLETFQVKRNLSLGLPMIRRLSQVVRESNYDITVVFAGKTPIAFESGDTTGSCFGVAVDIGTTTLAAYLIDLRTGEQVSVAASTNPQTRYGDDVISRISYTTQDSFALDRLRNVLVDGIQKLITMLADDVNITLEQIYEVCLVGNTCMTHLLLGVNPESLAQSPYVPVISQSLYVNASEIGLKLNESALAYVLPCIAGYVGADTVGVLLATGLYDSDRPILAVDIGTNGEIVLGSKERILACSTAAGPAFEGAHIKHGMRAAPGAIDSVRLEGDTVRFTTVGGGKAVGVCGSGLLDAIVCLIQAGIIDGSGRIVAPSEVPTEFASLAGKIREGQKGNEFILASPDDSPADRVIELTQRDVREVQLAKGAIAAGIQTLMRKMNIGSGDLEAVLLAGAFGNYVRKESAIAVGMIPRVPLERVRPVGNAAGEGAKLALISKDMREHAEQLAQYVEYVELTIDPEFQERFAEALLFDV